MSDELFPEEGSDQYEYEDEEDGKSIVAKVREKIKLLKIPGLSGDQDTEDEEDTGSSALPDESVSFLESEEEHEEEEGVSRVLERLDRFTVLVLATEILLVLYLAAAILGLVPFF